MQITLQCPHCKAPSTIVLTAPGPAPCPHCKRETLPLSSPEFIEKRTLSSCPVCGSSHLYRRKDFNRKWGLLLVGLGIAGAYFTYGLSLLGVTVIDWILDRRIGEVATCYQCETTFRKSNEIVNVPAFNLSLHDYYQNLRSAPQTIQ